MKAQASVDRARAQAQNCMRRAKAELDKTPGYPLDAYDLAKRTQFRCPVIAGRGWVSKRSQFARAA
jgi:hypothetical protein